MKPTFILSALSALCALLLSLTAQAGNIVLLTSLEVSTTKLRELEQLFRQAYADSNHQLVIHHRVGPALLYETLQSSHTERLFWVSHSAKARSLGAGLGTEETIRDVYGNDVKKFFTTTTPRLRFLAIVGCQSKSIIDGFAQRQNYIDRPNLNVFAFSNKTLLKRGLTRALRAAAKVEEVMISDDVAPVAGWSLQVTASQPMNELSWLEIGDRVLGVLKPGMQQLQTHISVSQWQNLSSANIQFFRSEETERMTPMPELNIVVPGHRPLWQLFKDRQGVAVGGGDKQLYLYRP